MIFYTISYIVYDILCLLLLYCITHVQYCTVLYWKLIQYCTDNTFLYDSFCCTVFLIMQDKTSTPFFQAYTLHYKLKFQAF